MRPIGKSVTAAQDFPRNDPPTELARALVALLAGLLTSALLLFAHAAPAVAASHRHMRTHAHRGTYAHRGRQGVHGVRHTHRRKHRANPRSSTSTTSSAPRSSATTPRPSKAAVLASVLASTCANTELRPTPQNIEAVTAATECLIDQERARNGELPLRVNGLLAQAAIAHSEEMVSKDYFAHIAPSGLTPLQRVEGTVYIPNHEVGYTVGENIAWGTLQLSTPSAIVAAWIASPEHLANILDGSYRDTAIGVVPVVPASLAQGQPGAIYSQEFGVIVGGR